MVVCAWLCERTCHRLVRDRAQTWSSDLDLKAADIKPLIKTVLKTYLSRHICQNDKKVNMLPGTE